MAHFPVFCILSFLLCLSEGARLIDTSKCPDGCHWDHQCVANAECKFLDKDKNCGYCVCSEGYQPKGSACKRIKGYTTTTTSTPITNSTSNSTTSTNTTITTNSTTTSPTSSTGSTTPSSTTQGPPPTPRPVNCASYNCAPVGVNENNKGGCERRMVIDPRQCNVQGGGDCYGTYCLNVSPGNDYCICPFYRVGRLCAVEKPGSCDSASGVPPSDAYRMQNVRLRHVWDKDNGGVYSRHFASTLPDCVKLCQWASNQCQSVNFGQINGVNVCELMSMAASKNNALSKWLEPSAGWQYTQVAYVSF